MPQRRPKRKRKLNSGALMKTFESLLDRKAQISDFGALLRDDTPLFPLYPPLETDSMPRDTYYLSVKYNRPDVVQSVLESDAKRNWNPLHVAVVYDGLDMMRDLSLDIPRYGHVKDIYGRTPLHWAFYKSNTEAIRYLLEKECWRHYTGEDNALLVHMAVEAYAWDNDQQSPISRWTHLIEWILGQRGIGKKVRNANGQTAHDMVCRYDARPMD